MHKTNYTKTVSREKTALRESLFQLGECQPLGDKPLVVISAGIISGNEERRVWEDLQKRLLQRSNRAKQLIASNSDHMIHHHQPEIVVEAIRGVIRISYH